MYAVMYDYYQTCGQVLQVQLLMFQIQIQVQVRQNIDWSPESDLNL